jgi:cobalt-precorrin-5B (C1)-methyltransferase
MAAAEPPARNPKGKRTGFTTGACAAAAAKAAVRFLIEGKMLSEIESILPNRTKVKFPLARCERHGNHAICSIIKDAGDDPDCTHGAEIIAEVELNDTVGIKVRGGDGVATVTKPGLGLEVGAPAINPIPMRNITEMVENELADTPYVGATITISVPRGEEMAAQTINARLGLLGGISILGTTGIVRPYSTAAFKTSVLQAIDVAIARSRERVVLTTGGKSESYAMQMMPDAPEEEFIQMGDFVGIAVRHCARRGLRQAVIVGMIGKLSKMADGKMQTHAAGSEVNMELLATLAAEIGASAATCEQIRSANTARHVLEICKEAGVVGLTAAICRRVSENTERHAGGKLEVLTFLIDFNGTPLGHYPADADATIRGPVQ